MSQALRIITSQASGVILYMDQEGRGIGLANKLRTYVLQDAGYDTVSANQALGLTIDDRDYSTATDFLKSMGVHQIRLLTNNPDKVHAVMRAGIEVIERVPLIVDPTPYSQKYLQTKVNKMGHLMILGGY